MHYEEIRKKYGISIEGETQYINKYIYIPSQCQISHKGKIIKIKNNSVLNPFKGSCTNKKCKRKYYIDNIPYLKNIANSQFKY